MAAPFSFVGVTVDLLVIIGTLKIEAALLFYCIAAHMLHRGEK